MHARARRRRLRVGRSRAGALRAERPRHRRSLAGCACCPACTAAQATGTAIIFRVSGSAGANLRLRCVINAGLGAPGLRSGARKVPYGHISNFE
jgi:hypothetical protein